MSAALILAALVGAALLIAGGITFVTGDRNTGAATGFVAAFVGAVLLVVTCVVALIAAVVPA